MTDVAFEERPGRVRLALSVAVLGALALAWVFARTRFGAFADGWRLDGLGEWALAVVGVVGGLTATAVGFGWAPDGAAEEVVVTADALRLGSASFSADELARPVRRLDGLVTVGLRDGGELRIRTRRPDELARAVTGLLG